MIEKVNQIDVIIASRNRFEPLMQLITQLQECDAAINQIIVVDSSDVCLEKLSTLPDITYIHTNHRNQPYQRYLGYSIASAPVLVFLDDDMEVIQDDAFMVINDYFLKDECMGLALDFENKNAFLQKSVPKSKLANQAGYVGKIIRWLKVLSGMPMLKPGAYSYNGNKGKQPDKGGRTEWFSGGVFAVRKASLYENFNYRLFDIYENGLGKGEDGILAYTLSKSGNIYFEPRKLFTHNDYNDSSYTRSYYDFSKRVAYSRLFLSYEVARLRGAYLWIATLNYSWYMLWRSIGIVLNLILDYKKERKEMLWGTLAGIRKAIKDKKYLQQLKDDTYWQAEVNIDIRH